MTWWEEVVARLAGVLLGGGLLLLIVAIAAVAGYVVGLFVERRRWTEPDEYVEPGARTVRIQLPRPRRDQEPL